MIKPPNQTQKIDIDNIIHRLTDLQFNSSTKYFPLQEYEIQALCSLSRQILISQPNLLELQPPINICGDIHGQFLDLIKLIKKIGSPSEENYLFLGDYVDRGKKSLECFCLLMAYKIKYPNNFFLLRGNHQCSQLNKIYGFYDEVKRKFNIKLWRSICIVFNYLPISAVVGDRIFCVHGGLSPQLNDIRQINQFKRPLEPLRLTTMTDMLWADPCPQIQGWSPNIDRGISYCFGPNTVDEFLEKYDFDLICRSHQVVQQGYQFFHDKKLVTIFTAPNYCGDFENLGAILHVSKDMKCSIEQFEAQTYCKSKRAKRSITPIPQQPRSTSPLKNITNEKNNHQTNTQESQNIENHNNGYSTKLKSQSDKRHQRRITNGKILMQMQNNEISFIKSSSN